METVIGIILAIVDAITFGLLGRSRGRRAGSFAEVARRHPRSLVVRAELAEGTVVDVVARTAADVIALVVTRRGLSFRDGFDLEIVLIPASDVVSLVPLDGDAVRVETVRTASLTFVLMEDGVDVGAALGEIAGAMQAHESAPGHP